MHQHTELPPPRPTHRRGTGTPLVAVLVLGALVGLATTRVEVVGASMEPTLSEGDRLVVVRLPRWWPLSAGQLVALFDPRSGRTSLMVKRVHARRGPAVEVRGDNQAASTDSRSFGAVDRREVVGLALYRYAPPERSGLVSRSIPSTRWRPGTLPTGGDRGR